MGGMQLCHFQVYGSTIKQASSTLQRQLRHAAIQTCCAHSCLVRVCHDKSSLKVDSANPCALSQLPGLPCPFPGRNQPLTFTTLCGRTYRCCVRALPRARPGLTGTGCHDWPATLPRSRRRRKLTRMITACQQCFGSLELSSRMGSDGLSSVGGLSVGVSCAMLHGASSSHRPTRSSVLRNTGCFVAAACVHSPCVLCSCMCLWGVGVA